MMNKRALETFKILLLIVLAVAAGYILFSGSTPEQHPMSVRVPDITLQRIGEGNLELKSLRGKPYLIEIWEKNCSFCRREIPDLNDLHRSETLGVVSLLVEYAADGRVDENFIQRLGIEYPVYRADEELIRSLGGLKLFPTAFLVDENGVATQRIEGAKNSRTLRELVELTGFTESDTE